MKTRTKEQEIFSLNVAMTGVTGILIMLLILILTSCGGMKTSLEYHKGLQKELTFENAMQRNEQFTLSSAKADLKEARKSNKDSKRKESDLAKVEAINKKIEELKNNTPR